jgi:hypothetical protein
VRLGLRHGGFALGLIANAHPALAVLAGESKHEILRLIPPESRPATALIPAGPEAARGAELDRLLALPEFAFPLILKPDTGCRGQSVRLARTREQALAALSQHRGATLLQSYHPGPIEVGVLYTRAPGASRGTILGITGKEFPVVIGDGRSTIAQLIDAHPRLIVQRDRFLERLGPRAADVPAPGQHVPLAVAGNHCQGTCFRDHGHLRTRALRRALDTIADAFVTPNPGGGPAKVGLTFGRFDIRVPSYDDLTQGTNLCVIELNGLSAEATHAYDPALSMRERYRHLGLGITAVYRMAARQASRGTPVPSTLEALRAIWRAARLPTEDPRSD